MAQSSPANLTSMAGAAVAAALLVFSAAKALAASPPHVGAPAPAFSLPVVANGKGTLTLAALKGHGVYLNFFASWCGPCKVETPYISRLAKEYAKRNVVVIGIDELEAPDRAKQFAAQYRVPYRVTVDGSGDVGGSYGLIGLPLHVFITPDGRVATYHVGEMSEWQVRAALQNLTSDHR